MFFLPALVVGLASYGGYKLHQRSKVHGMTPERKKFYEELLKGKVKPEALREAADAFEKEGLKEQAAMLRKRAMLKDLPKDAKKARNKAFRSAIGSDDPEGCDELADAFEQQGATGSAARLRERAAALRAEKQ